MRVTCNSLQNSLFFSQSVLKDAEYVGVFFASLTSLISFLASLQTSSLTVRARLLYQVPE